MLSITIEPVDQLVQLATMGSLLHGTMDTGTTPMPYILEHIAPIIPGAQLFVGLKNSQVARGGIIMASKKDFVPKRVQSAAWCVGDQWESTNDRGYHGCLSNSCQWYVIRSERSRRCRGVDRIGGS